MRREPLIIPYVPPEPEAPVDPWDEAWKASVREQEQLLHESCAIANYFRDYPEATSVMMTCHCPRCSPRW